MLFCSFGVAFKHICPSVLESAVRKGNNFRFSRYYTNLVEFHLYSRNKDRRAYKTDDDFCTSWSEIFRQERRVFFSLADYNHIVWDVYIACVHVVDCTRNTQIYPTIDLICTMSKMFLMTILNQMQRETKVTSN